MSRGKLLPMVLVFVVALGYADASDNYTVNYGTNLAVTAHTNCRNVTNNSATGASVYVPTQTDAEWQSFYTNPPAGVTAGSCGCTAPWGANVNNGQGVTAYQASAAHTCVSQTRTCSNGTLSGSYAYASCSDTCAGTSVGGYCWYLGSAGQDCNQTCSARGGCNLTGTRNYAGSGGTNAQAGNVTNAVASRGLDMSLNTCAHTRGLIMISNGQTARCYNQVTQCTDGAGTHRRFCACNN